MMQLKASSQLTDNKSAYLLAISVLLLEQLNDLIVSMQLTSVETVISIRLQ